VKQSSGSPAGGGGVVVVDGRVALPGRSVLAVREHLPAVPPTHWAVLVHGLASNARIWDGVARRLASAAIATLAVDQRGHGRSPDPGAGFDTETCADDVAALLAVRGLTGERAPLVVGQSWGGNVVLALAARHPGTVRAVGCVDGGWIRLRDRFATFEDCWALLAPPSPAGRTYDEIATLIRTEHAGWPAEGVEGTLANLRRTPGGGVEARLSRDHHREILRSIYEGDPARWYPDVDVPVLLCPAAGPDDAAAGAREALAALPAGRISWYPGAHHDLHAEQPERLARELLDLFDVATEQPRTSNPPNRQEDHA